MKTAVAYIRVSKERDNMITQDTQLDKAKQYCDLHNLHLIKVYTDLDYSGRSTNRPQFQKLIRDIQHKELEINYILVYKLDRFARSVNDFHKHMDILDKHNVHFISITQQFDTSSAIGRLIRNILVDFAQFESEVTGERIKDNMIHNASQGKWCGGPVPLGFDNPDNSKTLIINKRAGDVLKFYEWYLQSGGSILNNTKTANELNIPSSTGVAWNTNQMGRILSNPIYCIADKKSIEYFELEGIKVVNKKMADGKKGFVRYNRRKPKGNTTEVRDKSKWIVAVGQHEGIITSDVFIKAQEKKTKRASQPPRSGTGKGLFAWLVKCGKCGKSLTYCYCRSKQADGTLKRYNYYRCRGWQSQGTSVCKGQSIRAEVLEKEIIDTIKNICNQEGFIERVKSNFKKEFKQQYYHLKKEIKKAEDKLVDIKREEGNLIDIIKMSGSKEMISAIEKEFEKLQKDKKKITQDITSKKAMLSDIDLEELNSNYVFSYLENFNKTFDNMEFEDKRNFLQAIIKKVEYRDEEAKLELFAFPSDNNFVNCKRTDRDSWL